MSLPLVSALLLAGAQVPAPAESPPPIAATPRLDAPAPHRHGHAPGDPLEGFNRDMFGLFQGIDKAVLRPAAIGYKKAVPRPVRSGLRNFFANLHEPIVFLNDMLQVRPGRAVRTIVRFVINSTVGIGGLVDVAKREQLPRRPNGFGDTLAYYGVKSGPYIFLPFVGPTTLRDLIGGTGDGLVLPTVVGTPFDRLEYQIPHAVITGLDQRAESDAELQALYASALDPYATLRSVYLQNRAAEIRTLKARHGDGPDAAPADDPLADPMADPLADPKPAETPQPPAVDPMPTGK